MTFFPLVTLVRYFVYNNPKVKFIYDCNHTEYYKKSGLSLTHKTRLNFNPFYFQLKYLIGWSQKRDVRLLPAPTTKVNYKYLSQYL